MTDETMGMADTTEPATDTDVPAGAARADWRAGIADDKTRRLAERFDSPAALAHSYAELNAEMSRRVRLPGESASEEEAAAFRKALGVPDTADAYRIPVPEHVPADALEAEGMQDAFRRVREAAHRAGASQDVLDAVIGAYWEIEADAVRATAANDQDALRQSETALRHEWGPFYDRYTALAKEALDRLPYGKELTQAELKNGALLGNDPNFIRLMAALGRATGEGGVQIGRTSVEGGQDMRKRYDTLSRDLHEAYARGDMDKARELDAERSELSERLHGTGPIVGHGRTF